MPTQGYFPDKWVCESPNKKARVEIRIPDADSETGYEWIEIPTMEVEQHVEKGESARIQRAAKVRFPTEWGSAEGKITNSPVEIINQYDADDTDPFTWARVSFRDQRRDDAPWILTHFGWIGGLGPASDPGVSKMWVYDPAELLSGTAVGVTFNRPTVKQASEKIAKLINNNTPIPLSRVEIVLPDTDEEFTQIAAEIKQSDLEGTIKGGFNADGQTTVYRYPSTTGGVGGDVMGRVADDENYTAAIIDTGEDSDLPMDADLDFSNTKSFRTNKHTLQDVIDYFEGKVGAKIHFQPRKDGRSVRLMVDIEPERRVFAQDEVVRAERKDGDDEQYVFFQTVNVLKNDALYEMKPVNTLRMDGETGAGYLDAAADWLEEAGESTGILSDATPSNKFPYAKVQVPSLLEAAEGKELGPRRESDATTESDVINEATKELTKLLEEAGEGEVVMKGMPEILPFDALDSFEVCNDHVVFEQRPVRYEIESVRHTAAANDIYKTRVLVSVWAGGDNIEVVKSGMADVQKTIED